MNETVLDVAYEISKDHSKLCALINKFVMTKGYTLDVIGRRGPLEAPYKLHSIHNIKNRTKLLKTTFQVQKLIKK